VQSSIPGLRGLGIFSWGGTTRSINFDALQAAAYRTCFDGSGINKEHFEKIFGTFQRSPTTKENKGLGLGLAIVKEIAEKHGGRARVERRLKKGVTFFISLAKTL
jgi:light-regulated signal transduction histidine kinase (bacteriophytochrome)